MSRPQLSDADWEFVSSFLPVGEYGPYPENLRAHFEGVVWRFSGGREPGSERQLVDAGAGLQADERGQPGMGEHLVRQETGGSLLGGRVRVCPRWAPRVCANQLSTSAWM